MSKYLLIGALSLGIAAAPLGLSAATYHYLDLTGEVVSIEAGSAADAMAQARASGDVLHSGVKLDEGLLEEGDSYGVIYSYVNTSGNLSSVIAASLDAARLLATDRTLHSGFMRMGLAQ